jgi:p-hydroxybenzoate 3-monooxygenase
MRREGLLHEGIEILFKGQRHRIHFRELVGRCVIVYGQQEVVKDLIAARLVAGGTIVFDAEEVRIHDFLDGASPSIRYRKDGEEHVIHCDFLGGCDGFHGICRPSIPAPEIRTYDRLYPFAWLGILAQAAPASDELIYSKHERGFALSSMRTPSITRLYLQCAPDEDLALWPDDRIWDELQRRVDCSSGFRLNEGPILQKGVTPMRSFVTEPMRFGRLFLAGDSAHIVPPTGAKGMNLAIADVRVLSLALKAFYSRGASELLDTYTENCLRRVWRAQHFSWWMTSILHRWEGPSSAFDYRRQLGELDNVTSSRAAAMNLAENYTGLPID